MRNVSVNTAQKMKFSIEDLLSKCDQIRSFFIEHSDLFNYADDSTLYESGEFLSIIIENLKTGFLKISKWFHKNFMVLNPDKFHFMVLGDLNCTCNFTCNGTIESSKEEKVLGITIDDKLTFTSHLGHIIKKANQKLHALSRVK